MSEEAGLAEKLTRVYLKIRDEKAKLSAEYKEKESSLNQQMDKVKAALLDYCKEHGVESVKTSEGLFYRSVKTRYWTSDWEQMHKFVLEHEVPEFMEKRLSISLDLYYNLYTDRISIDEKLVIDSQGLPNLEQSSFQFSNKRKRDRTIFGSELAVRYHPSRNLSLLASWTYREVFDRMIMGVVENTPKNLVTLGGRFRSSSGLVGSLYMFSRSEFTDSSVENPEGLLAPKLTKHIDDVFLFMGKLGYEWITPQGIEFEIGAKLFLPFSPFSGNLFRYYDDPGGITAGGHYYGGQQLRRVVTGYLQGSF